MALEEPFAGRFQGEGEVNWRIEYSKHPVFRDNPELQPLLTTRFGIWPTKVNLNLSYQFSKRMETVPSDVCEIVHVKQDCRGRIEPTNQKGKRTVVRIETESSGLHLYSTWEKQPQEPYYTKRQIWFESKGSFQGEIIGDDVIVSLDETKLLFPKEFKVNELSQALSSGLSTPAAFFELSRKE